MRLSKIVEAAGDAEAIRAIVQKLVSLDRPCWKLAGRLAVALQRRGHKNAAQRVQMAATDENEKALGTALQDLLRDRGLFPGGAP